MRFILLSLIFIILLILYACVVAGARADEQSQRMFEEYQKRKFEKK